MKTLFVSIKRQMNVLYGSRQHHFLFENVTFKPSENLMQNDVNPVTGGEEKS